MMLHNLPQNKHVFTTYFDIQRLLNLVVMNHPVVTLQTLLDSTPRLRLFKPRSTFSEVETREVVSDREGAHAPTRDCSLILYLPFEYNGSSWSYMDYKMDSTN